MAAWRGTPPDQRVQTFELRAREDPDSCADLYLLGAALVRDHRISDAAQAFGAAYHRDCDLNSAALMTFACLKAGANADGERSLATLIEQTWDEMRRPQLGRRPIERRLLSALIRSHVDDARSIALSRFVDAMLNTSGAGGDNVGVRFQ